MANLEKNTDWDSVPDKDIPVERVATRADRQRQRRKGEYLIRVPVAAPLASVTRLGGNCFEIYALLTTAEAAHPRQEWHHLPPVQLKALGLSRHQIKRATQKLEAAGIVEVERRRGCKTLYRRNVKGLAGDEVLLVS